ncbi:hypothetical protein BSKO_05876 [Bryopsis sp. KO-2023]|nr:hypothetical protein BSKO_05876 [Bryopsis sp. KO-2023]
MTLTRCDALCAGAISHVVAHACTENQRLPFIDRMASLEVAAEEEEEAVVVVVVVVEVVVVTTTSSVTTVAKDSLLWQRYIE